MGRGGDIVDLACGTGTTTIVAQIAGVHAYLMDITKERIAIVRERRGRYGAKGARVAVFVPGEDANMAH